MPKGQLDDHAGHTSVLIDCPGCGMVHAPVVSRPAGQGGPVWGWNGSLDRPTFTPSLLVTWEHGPAFEKRVCHSFITDGRIAFLSDCTHKLAGQTVDLPEFAW